MRRPVPGSGAHGGSILELGAGIGEDTAFLLSGMDSAAGLITVGLDDPAVQAAARELLGAHPRVAGST